MIISSPMLPPIKTNNDISSIIIVHDSYGTSYKPLVMVAEVSNILTYWDIIG